MFRCWVGLSGLNITLFLLHVESLTGGFLPQVMWLTSSPLVERKLALLGVRLELFLLGVLVFLIKVSEDSELRRKHLVQLNMRVFPCKKQPISEHYLHADVEVKVRRSCRFHEGSSPGDRPDRAGIGSVGFHGLRLCTPTSPSCKGVVLLN